MKKFFINYSIGARGDFLINCLVEADILIIKALNTMAKIPPLIYHSAKIHGILEKGIITGIEGFPKEVLSFKELFQLLDNEGFVKLKIVATEPDELLDASWFALSKVLIGDVADLHEMPPNQLPKLNSDIVKTNQKNFVHLAHDMIRVQELDKDYIDNYDFVIKFNDLFDLQFLGDLYFRIHNKKIGYAHLKAIRQNIEMQERLSKSPFYQQVLDHYNNPIH